MSTKHPKIRYFSYYILWLLNLSMRDDDGEDNDDDDDFVK